MLEPQIIFFSRIENPTYVAMAAMEIFDQFYQFIMSLHVPLPSYVFFQRYVRESMYIYIYDHT